MKSMVKIGVPIELLFESMNDVRLANIAIHCLTAVPQSAQVLAK